jgi:hypothetical protein
MASGTVEEYQIGELVKWFEPYADGDLVRDVGYGVILKKNEYDLGFKEGLYTNYTVYRNKHSDTMRFEQKELEKLDDK